MLQLKLSHELVNRESLQLVSRFLPATPTHRVNSIVAEARFTHEFNLFLYSTFHGRIFWALVVLVWYTKQDGAVRRLQ